MFLRACVGVVLVSLVVLMTSLYNPLPAGVNEPGKVQAILMLSGAGNLLARTMTFLGMGPFSRNLRWVLETALDKNLSSAEFGDVKVWRAVLGGVPCVLYRPHSLGDGAAPAALYFHGGGFVVGSAASYDLTTYTMAKEAQIMVISVDYRLAPEHPFPAAPEDCLAVTRHVLRDGAELGVDVTRVGVAGDSAGGNLAAVVALAMSQDKSGLPALVFQVLYYPWLQAADFHTPSYINNHEATPNILSRDFMGYMTSLYFGIPDEDAATTGRTMAANKHIPEHERQGRISRHIHVSLIPEEFRALHVSPTWRAQPVNGSLYSRIQAQLQHPLFCPLLADDVSHVPPAFVHAAEFDVLRDDALMYWSKLQRAGVHVTGHVSRGGYHSEVSVLGRLPMPQTGRLALTKSITFMRTQLKL